MSIKFMSLLTCMYKMANKITKLNGIPLDKDTELSDSWHHTSHKSSLGAALAAITICSKPGSTQFSLSYCS